ncbi:MAG TPA: DNA polymerase III subunit alpha [bacterium]|nr:DNA polymerase III subunit alpha [bacterium]
MKDFVHLHLHTEHSLLDGMCRISEVTALARKYGMKALAITDHGTMGGVLKFYMAALKHGVKPIIGSEMYIAPGSRFDKKISGKKDAFFHITLLAKNYRGYQNLLKLSTLSFTEGYYYKQRIDKEILSQYSEGIMALGGCLKGEVNSLLLEGEEKKAEKAAGEYREILGKENFYLEVMDNKLPDQDKANRLLAELGRKEGIGLVATNDCHYLYKEDAFAHEVLLCIQTQAHMEDTDRMRFQTDEFYFKTAEEMKEAFKEMPESIRNTVEISEKCNLQLPIGEYHLPKFSPPEGQTPEEYLEKLIKKGIEEKFRIDCEKLDENSENEIIKRAAYEFGVIKKMGFPSYFLIIHDFVGEAKKKKIMVGPGRGSAAGSLVAYLLNITEINPLPYNLIFERFLNPDRISLPDIDVDFCDRRRFEVVEYIKNKYGEKNVAQIGTYGRMATRAVLKDAGRALGFSYADVDKIVKLISQEPGTSLEEELASNPEIKNIYETDENIKKLFNISLKLEGLARHSSIHAAGLVITENPVDEYAPLFRGPKGELATQYEMDGVEKIGLLKIDILGLKTLSVIEDALELIKERKGIEIKDFLLDDAKTYRMLADGNSMGIFQLESKGMQELLKDINPMNFEDIVAILALYRPGPMKSGMVKEYIKRKNDPSQIKYDHPLLESILKPTYGVILYQEQVMEIAHKMAGFTMGQADELRKSMGKKILEAMEQKRGMFIEGAKNNGVSEHVAKKIFEQIVKFAGYGFNKSHSAGYALLSYQTAYLKTNFPLEFMTSLLNSEIGNFDKISEYIAECERMNIWILPPDICESDERFKIFSNDIIYGLGGIKNVGAGAAKSILEAREKGRFKSLFDFCERVNLRTANRKVIESLIKAGAFDFLEIPRSQHFAMIDDAIDYGSKMQKKTEDGQIEIFASDKGKIMPETDREVLKSLPEWTDTRLLSYEKEMLGVYLTGHPLERYISMMKIFSTISSAELEKVKEGMSVRIGGILIDIKRTTTKKGERMGWGEVEDLTGTVKVLFYPRTYEAAASIVRKNAIIFVKGRLEKKDRITIVADEVSNINTAEKSRFLSNVEIDIKLPTGDEKLNRLKELFVKSKGNCPVYLNLILENSGKKIKIKANGYTVNPDIDFVEDLQSILGETAFHIGI